MMTTKPTLQNIAKEARVSVATVSRVLSGAVNVRPDKVNRVIEAVKLLGYRPNGLAGYFSQESVSRMVGVLLPQLHDEFAGTVLTGFESELRAQGFHMMCSLSHSSEQEERSALERFRAHGVSGLFLLAPCLPDVNLLAAIGKVSVVMMNRYVPELASHCIRLDNFRGSYLATKHLLEQGHTEIAHITGPLEREEPRERLNGYLEALRTSGIDRQDTLIVEGDFTVKGGQVATERLLRLTRFSAIFAANDLLACGALLALRDANIKVPDEISVIGFDDRSVATITYPALSTVQYPMEVMGALAAKHLIALMMNNKPDALPLMEPSLMVRASSGRYSDTFTLSHPL